MSDQFAFGGSDLLAHEREGELRTTAHELHGVAKPQGHTSQRGRIHRVRATLGRRLISLGSAVSGHHE